MLDAEPLPGMPETQVLAATGMTSDLVTFGFVGFALLFFGFVAWGGENERKRKGPRS